MPPSERRALRRRAFAAAALAVVLVLGLIVHLALPDTAATDIAGDALYALAVYAGVVLLFPAWAPWAVAAVSGGWCVAVEVFQLTGLPLEAATAFPPVVLVLGTVFDPRDLVVYAASVAASGALDILALRRRR